MRVLGDGGVEGGWAMGLEGRVELEGGVELKGGGSS